MILQKYVYPGYLETYVEQVLSLKLSQCIMSECMYESLVT